MKSYNILKNQLGQTQMIKAISWNLGYWQRERGIKTGEIAAALGMKHSSYIRLRKHVSQPRTQWRIILRICEVLDIDYYDLVRPM